MPTAEASAALRVDPAPVVHPDAGRGAASLASFCDRHFTLLSCAVLGLALFNFTFRLGHEIVYQWDESLYAISAWEMVKSGNWIATTLLGELDYYNTKPPLNVWLIALSFKAFGINLVSLRLPCVLSAWATVGVMVFWVRRCAGGAVGLLTGLVLCTCFGFVYKHSGRNANTDATFALLFALMVVALWASDRKPWRAAWMGPLLAATFLLRGPAALMSLVLIAAYWVGRQDWLRGRKRVAAAAAVLFLVPVIGWFTARWRIDQERFILRMFSYDLIARTARPLEGHMGSPFYYLKVLAKFQYDWLLAAAVAVLIVPAWHRRILPLLRAWRRSAFTVALAVWACVGLAVPTIISTKVQWYLNHSYPVFAVGVAALAVHAVPLARPGRRRAALAIALAVAFLTAESRLWWYSYHYRDLSRSPQGLLLAERERLAGHRVFRAGWDRAEIFVIGGVIGAQRGLAAGLDDFLGQSQPGDYLMLHHSVKHEHLSLVGTNGRNWLYRRER